MPWYFWKSQEPPICISRCLHSFKNLPIRAWSYPIQVNGSFSIYWMGAGSSLKRMLRLNYLFSQRAELFKVGINMNVLNSALIHTCANLEQLQWILECFQFTPMWMRTEYGQQCWSIIYIQFSHWNGWGARRGNMQRWVGDPGGMLHNSNQRPSPQCLGSTQCSSSFTCLQYVHALTLELYCLVW